MIDKLRAIAIFASVVDHGTFREAARQLGLSPSRVSETVSNLEKTLNVTLLYRSTRQLSLTNEGRLLHEQAKTMLAAAEHGLDAISPGSTDPHGTLRITAPAFVTQTALMDDFATFGARYPRVHLQFDFSDTPRELIKDGYDVSIRAGWLENSELMSRSIGVADRLLVASADYVKQQGEPSEPRDLEAWNWVRFSVRPDPTLLTDQNGQEVVVTGRSHISVNTADALYEFAARGLGVTGIPENLACRGIARGDLVNVLPDWKLKPLGLYAVWPDQSRRQNLTTMFVRFLAGDG